MGARLAAGGGTEGWLRILLTALGIGVGVAMLLLSAAVPSVLKGHDTKADARDAVTPDTALLHATDRSVLTLDGVTIYHAKTIKGLLVKAEGAHASHPPGIGRLPASGHMLVSPALRSLLETSPVLRARLPYTIDGTIGQAGLVQPNELFYYAGDRRLVGFNADQSHGNAYRITMFGHASQGSPLDPELQLLLDVMVVVLLVPVAVFVGTAMRLGGERRDRRMAAMRLVGADIAMTRRIAAGEAIFGACLGLLVGALLFLLGRHLAPHVTLAGISAYSSDISPSRSLSLLVLIGVPLSAVAITMINLRGVSIEPLGVVRGNVARRPRLGWRLALLTVGIGMLLPLVSSVDGGAAAGDPSVGTNQIACGVVLLLLGVTALLPWVMHFLVGLLRGGPVSWQLATRRLQMDAGANSRIVNGITVAVAGAVALQMLFTVTSGDFRTDRGSAAGRPQVEVTTSVSHFAQAHRLEDTVSSAKGVSAVYGTITSSFTQGAASKPATRQFERIPITVGNCPSLGLLLGKVSCIPGSVFLVKPPPGEGYTDAETESLRPGAHVDFNVPSGDRYVGRPRRWTIPASARVVEARGEASVHGFGLYATPQSLPTEALSIRGVDILVRTNPHMPDAIEYVRNAATATAIDAVAMPRYGVQEEPAFTQVRRALFVGASLTLVLIGASLLVSTLEQLRERKKLLAVLVAFGTRRSVLAWSVLLQTAILVAISLAVALAGGLGLGTVLLALQRESFRADWDSVLAWVGIGGAVTVGVTLLSLPVLWRLMRPDGLRTE